MASKLANVLQKWTRIDELENDKSTLRTKTTMFWISSECHTCDIVILSNMISGLIFQSRTTEERLLTFLNALLLFTKYQSSQTVGGAYDALRSNEKWRCRMKEGLVVTYCLFFFNRTENKDLQRWLTPKQSIGMFFCAWERTMPAVWHQCRGTHTTAGDICLF